MASLPLVLAGPILRRVETSRVSAWMAFSTAVTVTLHIFDGRRQSKGPGKVEGVDKSLWSGTADTIRCGERLHIVVVEASAPPEGDQPTTAPLKPGALYCYDVVIEDADAENLQGLLAMGLLADDPDGEGTARAIPDVSTKAPRHFALGYGDNRLPSFVTPAAVATDVRLAHASCRKMHGPGTDALSYLDDEIEKVVEDPKKRIQQLFLTGDQIYADDVPTTALPMIHDLAVALMSTEDDGPDEGREDLPLGTPAEFAAGQAPHHPVDMKSAPPLRRTRIIRTDGGFTTTGAANHIMTFAEYAALYLLSWSPRVWEQPADKARVFATAEGPSQFSATNLRDLLLKEGETDFEEKFDKAFAESIAGEQERIKVFAATVGKVARVLANTPTYMLFDDHDVTDDWNINAVFEQRVYENSALGRAVVRNALLAYALFQDMGNELVRYVPRGTPGEMPLNSHKFIALATSYLAKHRTRDVAIAAKLDTLFGFPGTDPDERMDFHYRAPGGCYEVIALDSRTRRGHEGALLGASLLLGDSLREQLPEAPARTGLDFTLLLVSTPVLGPELFERIALPMLIATNDSKRKYSDFERQEAGSPSSTEELAHMRTRGALEMDLETWSANEGGQHALLNRLVAHHPVVMLGGDVHHGDTSFMDFWKRDRNGSPAEPERARFVQLTSSAARNAFHKDVEAIYASYHWLNLWIAGPVVSGLGWHEKTDLKFPDGVRIPGTRRRRLGQAPVIVAANGWPEGTDFRDADDRPDWWFRMETAVDARKNVDRGAQGKAIEDLLKGPREKQGMERAKAAAKAHSEAMEAGAAPLRNMVMPNNVGLVRFERNGDMLSVVHTLLSSAQPGYPGDKAQGWPPPHPFGKGAVIAGGAPNTEVVVPLAKPAPREPAINGPV